ncbi:MAG: hypothetical protein FWF57_07005 [Defluviitaleaceae bacterium]|nr:hypothetical protein [Defluviitaleaceae bacterium]
MKKTFLALGFLTVALSTGCAERATNNVNRVANDGFYNGGVDNGYGSNYAGGDVGGEFRTTETITRETVPYNRHTRRVANNVNGVANRYTQSPWGRPYNKKVTRSTSGVDGNITGYGTNNYVNNNNAAGYGTNNYAVNDNTTGYRTNNYAVNNTTDNYYSSGAPLGGTTGTTGEFKTAYDYVPVPGRINN